MIRQFELVERVKAYDPNANEALLNRAYVFSMQAHGSQMRASGDPYFSHPLEVAGYLTTLRLDSASIACALLHDVVEDTGIGLDEIEKRFGPEVARLVDGVTKLSRLELQSDATKHAENLRKLVLAMSEDIRVLLVKLADRLHNMRTLHYVKNEEKRRRIAVETLEIYAPLAERIGMQALKDELEDFAFNEINPDARSSIINRLAFLRASGAEMVARVIAELKALMDEHGLVAEISGREKTPYSIWRKMQRKSVSFEQLSDIMAFRVIVADIEQCYQALGILHSSYSMVPGRFKDYVSTPKPNGYRSIHSCVIGPERQRIEVQIRTHGMHAIAEHGVAAHWSYKQADGAAPRLTEGEQYRWLRDLLDILEHASSPEEFLEHTKLAMFQDQVFVFSPKGDLFSLPRGATPVDFAYSVHSDVGDTCVGAKVNGRIVPLRTQLQNGDQVEILTSRAQTPSPAWEHIAVTAKARARIRKFIRTQERQQYTTLGRSILVKTFRDEGYELTERLIEGVQKNFRASSTDDIYAQVGQGTLSAREVLATVVPGLRRQPGSGTTLPASDKGAGDKGAGDKVGAAADKVVSLSRARAKAKTGTVGSGVPIRGLIPGMAIKFAGCCHPLPGDRIVGIVQSGVGVTVHTIDCEQLSQYADAPDRWLDVSWDSDAGPGQVHVGRITATVANTPGALGNACTVIGKNQGNITNLRMTNRSVDFIDVLIDVEVTDVKHLANIIAALRASPSINEVERARG